MTEKNYNPQQKEKKSMKKQEIVKKKTSKSKHEKTSKIKEPEKKDTKKPDETEIQETKEDINNNKEVQEKQEEVKKETIEKKDTLKKTEKTREKKESAVVNVFSLPISLKQSKYICNFIKGKRVGDAIRDLKEVQKKKLAVPMKGEIPHRKGMMSGRYPMKASKYFINTLKTLAGNSTHNQIEEPVITEAQANFASRPYSRF